MKPKTMILMGVAVVCGLVASYMTSQLIAENKQTVKVLVCNARYTQYTPLQDPVSMMHEEEIPKNDAPKNFVPPEKMNDIKSMTLKRTLEKDDKVTFDDLQAKDKSSMEVALNPGMRAFAVSTSAVSASGGFVLPNSHVDVILTSRTGDHAESKFVLQNILVRAVDQLPIRPEDKPGIVPSTITLEVTPEQVLKLNSAVASGSISLALRPFGDKEISKDSDVGSAAPTVTTPTPPPPPPPPPLPVVEEPKKHDAEPPPLEITKVMTVFNGPSWVQRTYTLDKNGNVLGTEVKASQTSAEPKAAEPPSAPPATPDKPSLPPPPPEK